MKQFTCLNCGKKGRTNRSNQRFCDSHCRQIYHDKQRRPAAEFEKCRFNKGVECSGGDCSTCGWNPDVAEARKAELVGVGV